MKINVIFFFLLKKQLKNPKCSKSLLLKIQKIVSVFF